MINHVSMQGRLAADAELAYTASQVSRTEFTLCWSDKYKDVETKCFLRCKAWRGTAEFISKYFHKGDMIIIDGHLITEEWEKDGERKSRTICMIDKAHFAGSRPSNTQPEPADSQQAESIDEFMNIPDDALEELPFA